MISGLASHFGSKARPDVSLKKKSGNFQEAYFQHRTFCDGLHANSEKL